MSSTGKVWRPQGGAELRIESGGKITNAGTQAAAIADETGTADATYSTNEVDMINALKTKLNAALAALRGAGIIAT